jgi:tRNA(fMet)-specific endonuclease VapC
MYFFKGEGRVAARLRAVTPSEVVVPTPVLYELEVGALQSMNPRKRREQLREFLEVVAVAPFGPEDARAAARIRADLEKAGLGIGPLDTLIAGTAVARSFILVTHNLGEFSRVRGLETEDWY